MALMKFCASREMPILFRWSPSYLERWEVWILTLLSIYVHLKSLHWSRSLALYSYIHASCPGLLWVVKDDTRILVDGQMLLITATRVMNRSRHSSVRVDCILLVPICKITAVGHSSCMNIGANFIQSSMLLPGMHLFMTLYLHYLIILNHYLTLVSKQNSVEDPQKAQNSFLLNWNYKRITS